MKKRSRAGRASPALVQPRRDYQRPPVFVVSVLPLVVLDPVVVLLLSVELGVVLGVVVLGAGVVVSVLLVLLLGVVLLEAAPVVEEVSVVVVAGVVAGSLVVLGFMSELLLRVLRLQAVLKQRAMAVKAVTPVIFSICLFIIFSLPRFGCECGWRAIWRHDV